MYRSSNYSLQKRYLSDPLRGKLSVQILNNQKNILSKNSTKFADILAEVMQCEKYLKFNLDAVVLSSGSCFELMLSMKEHRTTTDREIISRKTLFKNPSIDL